MERLLPRRSRTMSWNLRIQLAMDIGNVAIRDHIGAAVVLRVYL